MAVARRRVMAGGDDKVAQVVNPITGELIDLETADDEVIMAAVKDMEDAVQTMNLALRGLRVVIQERMKKAGATLKITSMGKVRLRFNAKIADKRLVDALYKECPEELKKACFAFDIRPLKTGLNELAKMGDSWKAKVDSLYEQVPSLVFEWNETAAAPDETAATEDDVPILF
jgi:hypothetical protein